MDINPRHIEIARNEGEAKYRRIQYLSSGMDSNVPGT